MPSRRRRLSQREMGLSGANGPSGRRPNAVHSRRPARKSMALATPHKVAARRRRNRREAEAGLRRRRAADNPARLEVNRLGADNRPAAVGLHPAFAVAPSACLRPRRTSTARMLLCPAPERQRSTTASTDWSWVLPFPAEVSNGRFIKGKGSGKITAQVGRIFAIMATAVQDGAPLAKPGLVAFISSFSQRP